MGDIDVDEDEERRTLFLFGRDVSQIPCFRESFLNGIIGGVAIGLGTFMRTSRPRQACNYAIGSQTLITLLYWSYCRYSWSRDKFMVSRIQEGMRRHAMYQGTDVEREMREEYANEQLDMKEA